MVGGRDHSPLHEEAFVEQLLDDLDTVVVAAAVGIVVAVEEIVPDLLVDFESAAGMDFVAVVENYD
jgi:hypothetical protein